LAKSATRACGLVKDRTSGTGSKTSMFGAIDRSERVPERPPRSVATNAPWKTTPLGPYWVVTVVKGARSSKSRTVVAADAGRARRVAAATASRPAIQALLLDPPSSLFRMSPPETGSFSRRSAAPCRD
jgi:hypothetical protein